MQKKALQKLVYKLLKLVLQDGKLNEAKILEHVKVLKTLPKNKAIFALSCYLMGLKQQVDKYTLVIESATILSSAQIESITKPLKKKYSIMKIKSIENKNLLGGIRLRVGDAVFDDTVASRIEQVRSAIHG